jgi:hypothetical protein
MTIIDPYTEFSTPQKNWFMAVIEGLVKNPDAANFMRVKGGNDLEIAIKVAPEDSHVFTPDVCRALKTLLILATGALAPVVYLYGNPHPEAQAAIEASRLPG